MLITLEAGPTTEGLANLPREAIQELYKMTVVHNGYLARELEDARAHLHSAREDLEESREHERLLQRQIESVIEASN